MTLNTDNQNTLAPVVLFVYNRPDHAKEVIESLARNTLALNTELYVFSDAAKTENQKSAVDNVRTYLDSLADKDLFKKITIIKAKSNKGLAPSIISGVSEVISKFKKVIVVEDDSLTSPDFLEFMNNALSFYQDNPNVWSIGGYTFLNKFPINYNHDVFLMGRTCSYAWATWIDRWEKVDWDVKDYKEFKHSWSRRKEFDKYGNDRSLMLDAQQMGRISSWAIRFCYAEFKNGMKTVYPRYSRVMNIGQDGSGVHFKKAVKGLDSLTRDFISIPHKICCEDVQEDIEIYEEFRKRFTLNKKKWLKKIIVNLRYKWFKIK